MLSHQKGFAQLFVLFILLAGILIGSYLVQQKTNLFPQASENKKVCPKIELSGNIEVVSRQGCKKASEILEGRFLCSNSTNYISTKDIPGISSKCENINYFKQEAQKYCKNLGKNSCLPNVSPSPSPSANKIKAAVIFVYFNNGSASKTFFNPKPLIKDAKAQEPSSKPTPRPIDPITGSRLSIDYVKQMLEGSGDTMGVSSVNDFYNQTTHGKYQFSFDYFGWYQAQIQTPQSCDSGFLMQLADNLAVNNGVNLNPYQARVYIFPELKGCPFEGIGGKNLGKTYSYALINDSQEAWVFSHEVGHALDIFHAGSETCRIPDNYSDQCEVQEYGDQYDIMGGLGYFNAPHQEMLKVIGNDQAQYVTTSGQYEIAPIELDTHNKQFLKIRKKDTEGTSCSALFSCQNSPDYYYVEYRRPIGVDANVLLNRIKEGILVHLSTGAKITGFVDTKLINPTKLVLQDGAFIYDQINDITIKQISHDESNARVQVTFGPNPYQGPARPNLISSGCGKGNISFYWGPAEGAVQYKIYKDNVLKSTVDSNVLRYEDTSDPSINSLYHVIAVDNSGISSAPSNSLGSNCSP